MPKPLNNIHDKFVKDMFADKELAIAFLEEMLPENVTEHFDFTTLTYNDKSYITSELEEIFSDMVMDIDLNTGSKLRICILLEHKSYVDPNVTIQILRYLGEAYHKQLIAKEALRPILPLLYYHGKQKWEFEQLENKFIDFPDIFRKYLPLYVSEFANLSEMSEEQLGNLRNGMLHAALEVQKYGSNSADLVKRLRHIGNNLNPYLNTGFAIKVLIYLLQTTEITLKDFKDNLPEPVINKVMSTYDRIVAESVEKGLEQGMQKGRSEERRKVILNSFDNGIDLETIKIITGESLGNITKTLKLHKRIS